MKTLHLIAGTFLFLLVMGITFLILFDVLRGDAEWYALLEKIRTLRLEVFFGCVGALLLLVIYGLSGIPTRERVQYLAYDIEGGGAVSISVKAIQDFVARIGDEFSQVVSLHPKLRAVNGAVDVQLDVKVKSGSQIPELCRMMQDRARECIRENVGISDIKEIRVRVQEIVGQPAGETISSDSKVL